MLIITVDAIVGYEERSKKPVTGHFLAMLKKYTDMAELAPTILNEFMEKVIVHARTKAAGNGHSSWKSAITRKKKERP